MYFNSILVGLSVVLCSVTQCICAEAFNDKEIFICNVGDYFYSVLSDLNPQQESQVVFNNSYAVFCKLIPLTRIFYDDHDFLFNHPELFPNKIPKNLMEVMMNNLNSEGQFLLYPEFPKISFSINLEDYPELLDYLIKIESLVPSESYVSSFDLIKHLNIKGDLSCWHEFMHFLKNYDSTLFARNPFFQLIYDLEYIFFMTPYYASHQQKNEVVAMKLFKLERILGKKISEQIKFYDNFDHTAESSSTTPSSTTKGWKKGNYQKVKGRGKCFNLRQNQLNTPLPLDSVPVPLEVRLNNSHFEEIDSLPVELRVQHNPITYVCDASTSSARRFKREPMEHVIKSIEDPVLKVLTYKMGGLDLLNMEIYCELWNEFKSSKDKKYSDITDYIKQQIKSGDSLKINQILRNLCEDEDNEIFDEPNSYPAHLEEAKYIIESLRIVFKKIDLPRVLTPYRSNFLHL